MSNVRWLPAARRGLAGRRGIPALAAGAVSVAVVAPVLAVAAPAQASGGTVWDRLAQCESSGDWQYGGPGGHVDPGYAEFEGGLNFAPQTWLAYRLSGYPSHAWAATRGQQIEVGKRVLRAQGWGAWPECSRKLGLHDTAAALATPTSTALPTHHNAAHHAGRHAKRGKTYVVRAGDTLSRIAQRFGMHSWRKLYRMNRSVIGHNPDVIMPGERLHV